MRVGAERKQPVIYDREKSSRISFLLDSLKASSSPQPSEVSITELNEIIACLESSEFVRQAGIPLGNMTDSPDLEVLLTSNRKVYVKIFPNWQARNNFLINSRKVSGKDQFKTEEEFKNKRIILLDCAQKASIQAIFEHYLSRTFPHLLN